MTLLALQRETLGHGGRTVLSGVSLTLSPGERVVLLGRSGAGKSTLLGAVHGQLAPRLRVALVPQDNALVPQLSVLRNTMMGRLDDHGALYNLRALIRPPAAARAGVAALLDTLGLLADIDRPVGQLSGGQKQRVALARAFWRGGALLIGDEPVSAVDERQAQGLLDELRARFDTSLLALHDVAMARAFATRLVGIGRGAIVFDAPPAEVSDADIAALYTR